MDVSGYMECGYIYDYGHKIGMLRGAKYVGAGPETFYFVDEEANPELPRRLD
jgi:hypothetical protein